MINHESDRVWPQEGLERVTECPVCGGTERVLAHEKLTDTTFFCAPGEWNLYRCAGCRSCYLDPRPTRETIHLAYDQYLTHLDGWDSSNVRALPLRSRLQLALMNGYCNWLHGTCFQPASKLGILLALIVPRRLRGMLRHLPRVPGGGRLLDVGAGNGLYLLQARKVGWDVAGAEPDPKAVTVARRAGLHVRLGGIECFADEPESFDFITLNHVVEHVHDPRDLLSRALALLKPHGCLFLETPNIHSFSYRKFGPHWRGLEPPRHLVLFHWRSLEVLLREVGFSRIKRLPRANVRIYPDLAARSRAIAHGSDPESGAKPILKDLVTGALLDIAAPWGSRNSEFVTLIASKR